MSPPVWKDVPGPPPGEPARLSPMDRLLEAVDRVLAARSHTDITVALSLLDAARAKVRGTLGG